jgi:hypothetical protein
MCKKLGVTALVVVAALFVLHKLELDSYLKVAWTHWRQDINRSISPEMKLERLRVEIDKLGPEINKHTSAIAREMTEVDKLKGQIAVSKANLDKKEAALKDLKSELDKGTAFVTFDGDKIPREKVQASLARQWESFKVARDAVKSQEELLQSREEALEVAKAKLAALQDKKREMQTKVEKMDLELRKLRLAQTRNGIAVDDSQMATVLKLADEIDSQIKTQENELALQKAADVDATVQRSLENKAKTEQAMKEMDDFFKDTKVTKKD